MAYRVEIAPRALRDIEEAFLYIQAESPSGAARWLREIIDAILSLKSLPHRCPTVPDLLRGGVPVRVLLTGLTLPYKVFFTVVPGSRSSGVVRVLHVRLALRGPWLREELS
jgi:plasmid stabilization system protein ParE